MSFFDKIKMNITGKKIRGEPNEEGREFEEQPRENLKMPIEERIAIELNNKDDFNPQRLIDEISQEFSQNLKQHDELKLKLERKYSKRDLRYQKTMDQHERECQQIFRDYEQRFKLVREGFELPKQCIYLIDEICEYDYDCLICPHFIEMDELRQQIELQKQRREEYYLREERKNRIFSYNTVSTLIRLLRFFK